MVTVQAAKSQVTLLRHCMFSIPMHNVGGSQIHKVKSAPPFLTCRRDLQLVLLLVFLHGLISAPMYNDI